MTTVKPGPTAPPEPLRILVIDDSADMADSEVAMLQSIGHDARAVYNSPEAVLVAAAFAPQLILLDLDMPDDDGFEVLRRLRHAQHVNPARIVAVTGHGEPDYLARTHQAGFDDHLVKPVNSERLQRLVDSVTAAAELSPVQAPSSGVA